MDQVGRSGLIESYSEMCEDYFLLSSISDEGWPGDGDLFDRVEFIMRLVFP